MAWVTEKPGNPGDIRVLGDLTTYKRKENTGYVLRNPVHPVKTELAI